MLIVHKPGSAALVEVLFCKCLSCSLFFYYFLFDCSLD